MGTARSLAFRHRAASLIPSSLPAPHYSDHLEATHRYPECTVWRPSTASAAKSFTELSPASPVWASCSSGAIPIPLSMIPPHSQSLHTQIRPRFGLRAHLLVRRFANKHLLAGVMGGLLTLPSFVETFPEIDTINTTGSLKSHNSTLQGML